MEENKDIILLLIDLTLAVKDNNLQQTQEIVSELNEITTSSSNLFDFFRINILLQQNYNNESLKYVIYNLNNYYNMEAFRWAIDLEELVEHGNEESIRDFLETVDFNNIKDYQISGLIRLYNVIQDYEGLIALKSIIREIE